MKRSIATIAAASLVGLAGCGVGQQTDISPAAMTIMTGSAPLDAARVTPTFGWVLTPDQLHITRDGGRTLSTADVPIPAGTSRAAYFATAETGLVAAWTGHTLQVARTEDGAQSWRTTTVRAETPTPAGYSSLNMSFGDASHGAILARTATSQAFSLATIFVTTNGGANWSAYAAPEAGAVRVEPGGRIWVAGITLNRSDDHGKTWTPSTLTLAGPVTAATITPPLAAILPVTVLVEDRTEVQLLTTNDGGLSWDRPTRIAVRGKTGPRVRLAVTDTASGLVVYDTVAGHAYGRTGAELRPSGLTDGVQTVTFTENRTGWALAGHGTCRVDKRDCAYHHDLLATNDGGTTWHTVAAWRRQIR